MRLSREEKGTPMLVTHAHLFLVAVALAGVAAPDEKAEQEAIRQVEKAGGEISRGKNRSGGPVLGLNFADKCRDRDMTVIAHIRSLSWLILSESKITDASLKHLIGLKQLQALALDRTGV